jgi:hypothetical protein
VEGDTVSAEKRIVFKCDNGSCGEEITVDGVDLDLLKMEGTLPEGWMQLIRKDVDIRPRSCAINTKLYCNKCAKQVRDIGRGGVAIRSRG